jgi:hypothetical protein
MDQARPVDELKQRQVMDGANFREVVVVADNE